MTKVFFLGLFIVFSTSLSFAQVVHSICVGPDLGVGANLGKSSKASFGGGIEYVARIPSKFVYSNAVEPGWVPTKMGGRGAPDNLEKGYETQVWLAVSNDEKARVKGRYFFHQKENHHNHEADNSQLQEEFLNLYGDITGISFPPH